MDWAFTIALATLLVALLYWLAARSANYWRDRNIPHVKSYPIVGNSLGMLLGRQTFNDLSQMIYDQLKSRRLQYGGYLQFSRPVLMILDPDLINTILIKDFTSFEDRGFAVNEKIEPINANLANLTGRSWRIMRHKLVPTFTTGKLKSMLDQIVHCSDNVLQYVSSKEEPFEGKLTMQKFNLNVIGAVAFGWLIDTCHEDDETRRFLELANKIFKPTLKTIVKTFFRMCSPKLADMLRLKMLDEEVGEFFSDLVRNTLAQRKQTGRRGNDFLQLMLDLQEKDMSGTGAMDVEKEELEPDEKEMMAHATQLRVKSDPSETMMTEERIIAQSILFIAGGSETTATALSFSLYRLATEKTIQERLQDEIDTVLAGQEFTYLTVKKMTYLDQFINEVLRLHPPGGVLFRECTKPYKLPGTDTSIEKGVMIAIPVAALQKDSDYFPEPEIFDPDRFGPDSPPPKGVYLPFGDGPRNCIANRLALFEMKVFLARLLMKYTISLNEKTKLPLKFVKNAFFAVVEGGLWLQLEKRSTK